MGVEVSHRWLVMELGDKRFLTRNPRVGLPGVYKTVKLYAGFCVYVYMCVHSCVCVCVYVCVRVTVLERTASLHFSKKSVNQT